jgi:hypothetical protein
VGETVDVRVVLDTRGNEVAHAPYYVIFDVALLDVVEVKEGDLLRAGGAPTMFLQQVRGGQIIVGHSRTSTPPDGTTGSGTLATLTFRGKAAGKATIFFTQDHVAGPSNQTYATQRGTATVTVQ